MVVLGGGRFLMREVPLYSLLRCASESSQAGPTRLLSGSFTPAGSPTRPAPHPYPPLPPGGSAVRVMPAGPDSSGLALPPGSCGGRALTPGACARAYPPFSRDRALFPPFSRYPPFSRERRVPPARLFSSSLACDARPSFRDAGPLPARPGSSGRAWLPSPRRPGTACRRFAASRFCSHGRERCPLLLKLTEVPLLL